MAKATNQPNTGDTTNDPAQASAPTKRAHQGSTTEGGQDIQWFDGTITKIDKDGNTVMSDHLLPGERLRREDTDRYQASLLTREGVDRDGDGNVDREHREYRKSDSNDSA